MYEVSVFVSHASEDGGSGIGVLEVVSQGSSGGVDIDSGVKVAVTSDVATSDIVWDGNGTSGVAAA